MKGSFDFMGRSPLMYKFGGHRHYGVRDIRNFICHVNL